MKRTIAGTLSLMMAVSAASCGKTEEKEPAAESSSAAETTVASTTTAADHSAPDESSEDESESEDESKKDDDSKAEKKKKKKKKSGEISMDIISVSSEHHKGELPDDDTIVSVIKAAAAQYDNVRNKDAAGYFKSMHLPDYTRSDSFKAVISGLQDESGSDALEDEQTVCYKYWVTSIMLSQEMSKDEGEEARMQYQGLLPLDTKASDEQTDKFSEVTAGYMEKAEENADAGSVCEWIDICGIDNRCDCPEESMKIVPEAIQFQPDICVINERGTFLEFDMTIFSGDYKFDFEEVHAFVIDGIIGIDAEVVEIRKNKYSVHDTDEFGDADENSELQYKAHSNAEAIYDELYDSLYDFDTGETLDICKLIDEGGFLYAESPMGLDLSDSSEPQSTEGDRKLMSAAYAAGVKTGYVFIGKCVYNGHDTWFIQWREKGGSYVGQCPCAVPLDDADIIWGTFLG